MPNLIDYLLENPERRWRIFTRVMIVFVIAEALWLAGIFMFVKD